jgi:protocatechuate 3,4-dioxygenase beta subunit
MCSNRRWIKWRLCTILPAIFILAVACTKEESSQKRQVPRSGSRPSIVATESSVSSPTAGHATGAQIAPRPQIEEKVSSPTVQKEDALSTGPRLVVSGRVSLQDGSSAVGAAVQLIKLQTDFKTSSLIKNLSAKASTDGHGHYEIISGDYPYFYLIAFHKAGARVTTLLTDERAQRGEEQTGTREITHDFVLPPVAHIGGRVIDEGDRPVAGAPVTAFSLGRERRPQTMTGSETTADEQGCFSIDDMTTGKVVLVVASPKHVLLTQEITAPVDDLILRLTSEGASLAGWVYLLSTGEAVSGAKVQVYLMPGEYRLSPIPRTTETDQFGAFRLAPLAAGQYLITAHKDELYIVPSKDRGWHSIVLAEKEKKSGIKLFLYEGHTIRGKVTERYTNKPLEGVKISVVSRDELDKYADITGPDGEYVLSGLARPYIYLKIEKKGYIVANKQDSRPYMFIQLTPDDLEITQNIEMMPTVAVSGIVKNAEGHAVTNAKVSLRNLTNWSRHYRLTPVDESGAFTLEAEPFVACRVRAEAPGYAPSFSDVVEVKDTDIKDVAVVMKTNVTISGEVVDFRGEPVERAVLEATQRLWLGVTSVFESFGRMVSDSSGKFTFSNLPPGEIRLTAQKEGFAPSQQLTFTLNPGEVKTGVKIVLRESRCIAGRITNTEGEPVENVYVSVYATDRSENSSGNTRSDDEGHYRIEGLADTLHDISLHHPNYGDEFRYNIEVGREDLDFVLHAKGNVTFIGKVVDWKSGEPIANFAVSSQSGAQPVKDPDVAGQFKAENLRSGSTYSFHIEAPGYSSLDSGNIVMPEGEQMFEKTFAMGPGGSIVGRVIKRDSKQPLSGLDLYVKHTVSDWEARYRPPDAIAKTDEEGRFRFDNVPDGKNTVVFDPPAPFVTYTRQITVEHGGVADLGDVEIGSGAVVKGRVLLLPNDIPVPATSVELQSQDGHFKTKTTTDNSGAFEFKGLEKWWYMLRVPDYDVSYDFRMEENEIKEYDFRIGSSILRGRVVRNGKPVIARVTLRQMDFDQSKVADTDDQGNFEIKNMAPGRWLAYISFRKDENRKIAEWVYMAPQGVTEKVFEFPMGRIVGMVVDANNTQVARAMVSVDRFPPPREEEAYNAGARTTGSDEDGLFVIEDLFAGTYKVSARQESLGSAHVYDVAVPHNGDSEPVVVQLGAAQTETPVPAPPH